MYVNKQFCFNFFLFIISLLFPVLMLVIPGNHLQLLLILSIMIRTSIYDINSLIFLFLDSSTLVFLQLLSLNPITNFKTLLIYIWEESNEKELKMRRVRMTLYPWFHKNKEKFIVTIESKIHNCKSNYVTKKVNYEIIFKMFLIYNIISFFVYIVIK